MILKQIDKNINSMPVRSKKQFKYIQYLRNKYKRKSDAPKSAKWVFNKEWTPKGIYKDLPTKSKKKNEIYTFSELNEVESLWPSIFNIKGNANNNEEISKDILSLNESPEFRKENISIVQSDGLLKFNIIYGKNYSEVYLRNTRGVKKPMNFSIDPISGRSPTTYNISYHFQIKWRCVAPPINKNDVSKFLIKDEIKAGLLLTCNLLNEFEIKAQKAKKAAESRKKSIERKKEKLAGKVSKQIVLDEFANIFDICKTYSISEPKFSSKLGAIIYINLIPNISTFRANRQDYIDIDINFIDFYSELMTISERLGEQGVDVSISPMENNQFVVMIKAKKDVKKKSEKSSPLATKINI